MTFYICDRQKCPTCQAYHHDIDLGCRYTSDPEHALHKGQEITFELRSDGGFWEVDDGKATRSDD